MALDDTAKWHSNRTRYLLFSTSLSAFKPALEFPVSKPTTELPPFSHLLGIDTGGTFTDFVVIDLATAEFNALKVLSTPHNPALAINEGIEQLALTEAVAQGRVKIVHGSTVATNAALERKGVKTAYVTNQGLKDTLTIGRQTRASLYDLQPSATPPPVADEFCLEVPCRRDANGAVITPLTPEDIAQLQQQLAALSPDAVAINLLFSYLNDDEETRLHAALKDRYFVTHSAYVLPESGEYERGMATWLNAYLGPKVATYLNHLQASVAPSPLAIMQSNGGTMDSRQAGRRAVNMLLSGPAGGLSAAQALAQQVQQPRLLTFDMGGTSTDVALIDGDVKLTNEGKLGEWPVAVPMVDMHTIGAGGGSLAYVDGGGLLQVGPESAGAKPGPACYGLGGGRATVTDANAALGLLRPDSKLGGHMALNVDAANDALVPIAQSLGVSVTQAAAGIIEVVNERMTAALRVISINKGYNPSDFSLCCFGGAGGLHVCALAENLGMHQAVIPALGGVFSALGMLTAPKVRQLSAAHPGILADMDPKALDRQQDLLCGQAREQLRAEGVDISDIRIITSVDLRYQGQSFALNVPYQDPQQAQQAFHQLHQQRYGHQMDTAVELVLLRVRAEACSGIPDLSQHRPSSNTTQAQVTPSEWITLPGHGKTPVYHRHHLKHQATLRGPALICESLATTWIAPDWQGIVDKLGNILLTKT